MTLVRRVDGLDETGTRPAKRRARPGFRRGGDSASFYPLIGLPFLILFLVTFVPLVVALWTSLLDWNLADPAGATFVGLENFAALAGDSAFWHALLLTAYQVSVTVILQFALGMPIALLLARRFRGVKVLRSLYIIPMMTTPVVVGLMWRMLLGTDSGVVNYALSLVGAGPVDWLGDSGTAMPAVIGADLWLSTPFVVVILLAGLQSIPQEVYEAASVDGAGGPRVFLHITLPLLKPMILLALLFRVMDAIRRFDTIYTMTGGGPGDATETLDLHAYFAAFRDLEIGKGAAMAVVMLLIIMVFSGFLLARVRADD